MKISISTVWLWKAFEDCLEILNEAQASYHWNFIIKDENNYDFGSFCWDIMFNSPLFGATQTATGWASWWATK